MSSETESLVGTYVLLRVNPRAMVAGYADSPILAVASALGTSSYVALVEKEVQIPTSSGAPVWRMYRVSFVGRHSTSGRFPCTNDCIPIFPASGKAHSGPNVSIRPSKPFPLPECCHRPQMEAYVRVHRLPRPHHRTAPWKLSDEQTRRLAAARKMMLADAAADAYKSLPSIRSDATSFTFRSPGSAPRDEAEYLYARHDLASREHIQQQQQQEQHPTLNTLADLALSASSSPTMHEFPFSTPRPPRILTPASDVTSHTETSAGVSALFERARPRRHDTMESASVYSTTSTARSSVAVHLESPSTSKLALGAEVDVDDMPLVDVSVDLGEIENVPDPAGFMDERDVVIQLVRKAKERQQNETASRMLTPDVGGAGENRRLSMVRVRSCQSVDTAPSSRSRTRPNKLRRARTRSEQSARIEDVVSRSRGDKKSDVTAEEKRVHEGPAAKCGRHAASTSRNPLSKLARFLRAIVCCRPKLQQNHRRRTKKGGSRTSSREASRTRRA